MSAIPLRPLSATRQSHPPSVQFTTEEAPPSASLQDVSGLEGDEDYHELRRGFFENRDGNASDNGDRIHTEWRRWLWYLLEAPSSSSSSVAVHITSTGLICTSALITILETLPAFHATPSHIWFGLETTLVVCFTVEYAARFIAHSESWRSLFLWARCSLTCCFIICACLDTFHA
jgi:hypothetical protein